MRRLITGISGLAILAGTAFVGPALMGAADAADGSGAYGAWSLDAADRSKGAITFTGTLFPNATVTSSGQNLSVATSQTLSATTPFGAAYGASTGRNYLSVGLAAGVSRAEVTITFDVPAIAGTYGLAMGDVDAENIILSAKDERGNAVDVREWNGTDFNYAGGTDLPKWDGATGTITGNGVDTQGASMWIVPAQTVKSITLTQTRTSGFPAYQLWIAADIITATAAPSPTPTATAIPAAPAGKVTICHRTASEKNPYVLMTIDQAAVTRRGHDTHTGGVFPAKPWGDIIPPFSGYPGLNWKAGAAILNNQCEIAGEEPIAVGLATASPSASPSTSASASSSPSATASASASASPSASASTSASASSSATPSTSTSASPTAICTSTETALVNGGFEEPVIPAKSYRQLLDSQVPGWTTSATDQKIEIWSNGYSGVSAPQGSQFAEINATQDAELSQVVATTPGQTLVWSLYHRARAAGAAGDTMSVNIGPENGAPTSTTTFTDVLSEGWVRHTGTYVVPAGQDRTRFGFKSGPTASGNKSIGNFLDNIVFTTPACLTPEATAEPSNPVATPTATPSASTATSAPEPTATPEETLPTPTETVPPADTTPVVVAPDEPTTIPDGVIPDGAEVIGVIPPAGGTAEVVDGVVSVTPAPGTSGTSTVTVVIREKDGTIAAVPVAVKVGKAAKPCTAMPSALHFGVNRLPAGGAGCQPVTVTVSCSPLARGLATGDLAFCSTSTSGGRTTMRIIGGQPLGVKVTITGDATSSRPAIAQEQVFFVRR